MYLIYIYIKYLKIYRSIHKIESEKQLTSPSPSTRIAFPAIVSLTVALPPPRWRGLVTTHGTKVNQAPVCPLTRLAEEDSLLLRFLRPRMMAVPIATLMPPPGNGDLWKDVKAAASVVLPPLAP